MVAVFEKFMRRGTQPRSSDTARPSTPDAERTAGEMIAGCEYELRQLRRDVHLTRALPSPTGMVPVSREPFVLGARLRNEDFRAKLAAATTPRNSGSENGTSE